ncbi:MAG: aminoacyl-histidine dipeptidase [Spirochaetia bacterium]|nr:aminoacyl-histidine dipeptidase [Spirochaetia bacterium]
MQPLFEGLKNQDLWNYFYELSQIPRESGNEEGVRQFLLKFAKEHKLESVVDTIGNVILRKKAYPGYEGRPSVALQGHMDMVCVKTEKSDHDFATDPIQLVREGDTLCAKDTTLGGDNGIAVAMAMAILSDPKAKHGPLEAIFTVSEETGLTGAFNIEKDLIQSRLLINLDSEEEGVLYIGCAGGLEVDAKLKADMQAVPTGYEGFILTASGLLGGHSGGEIHKQRANAIKAVARALSAVETKMLFAASGGSKRNVIPSLCSMSFASPSSEAKAIGQAIGKCEKELQEEYAKSDPGITLKLVKADLPKKASSAKQSEAFIRSLYIAPHGVDAMSMTIKGIVETSSNLAIIKFAEGVFSVTSSHRSSILSSRDDIAHRMGEAMKSGGSTVEYVGAYPSWKPNPDSELTQFCAKAYEEYSGKKPQVTAIHAGLECGIINSRVPGMDSVSFGPNMYDVHSVKERLSLSSVENIMGFTRHVLEIIE